jgi:hypothetical protein
MAGLAEFHRADQGFGEGRHSLCNLCDVFAGILHGQVAHGGIQRTVLDGRAAGGAVAGVIGAFGKYPGQVFGMGLGVLRPGRQRHHLRHQYFVGDQCAIRVGVEIEGAGLEHAGAGGHGIGGIHQMGFFAR